jgi:transcription termination factor NusB
MNIYEIYVLNSALDGKDIFALPSLAKLNISSFIIDDIKNVLIKKGLLESESTFTEDGIRLTNRLRLFKQAEKHIQIGDISMGVLDKNESIILLYNPLLEDYKIEVMDSTEMTSQLVSFYSFLVSEGTDVIVIEEEVKMTKEEFNEAYPLDDEGHFHMLMQDKDKKRDEIYFTSDGKYYVYDSIKGLLSGKSYKNLMSQLEERMGMV